MVYGRRWTWRRCVHGTCVRVGGSVCSDVGSPQSHHAFILCACDGIPNFTDGINERPKQAPPTSNLPLTEILLSRLPRSYTWASGRQLVWLGRGRGPV